MVFILKLTFNIYDAMFSFDFIVLFDFLEVLFVGVRFLPRDSYVV